MTPHDAAARELIAKALDRTLVVEAAAGTGKTTALVGRIVAIVRAGNATLKQIIAVTFTEKAAGEMKLRLRSELEKARQRSTAEAERARLETALEELEVARIGTIHALCADLLREHPIEARVDPLFEVAKEPESQALLDAAFDGWLPQVLRDPPEGVRRLLRRRPRRRDQSPPRELLRRAAWQLVGHRDFDARWAVPDFPREQLLGDLVPKLEELAALSGNGDPSDYLKHNLLEVKRFISDLHHREPPGAERDWDGLEAGLAGLARHRTWSYKGFGEMFGTEQRAAVIAKRDAVKAALDRVLEDAEAHLAALLHADLWPVVALYEKEKERAGKLDFFDLLIKLRALLVSDKKVRNELQERFTHLFVDEFQDTDPLQADILRLLAADDATVTDPEVAIPKPGKLFIVGDPKQSIYRFRRADVALYESVKRQLGAHVVDLTTSFRGTPKLQEAINSAFAPIMVQDEAGTHHTQARYVPLTKSRADVKDQPSLIALPVPRPYSEFGKISAWQVDRSYPDAVGAFIEWVIEKSGWKVQEPGVREERLVPVQARHVCILFRRFRRWEGDDVTLGYTRALEARGIPHVLVGGRSFHGREEVLALRNALAAIEWPDDELSIYATLRGPLFALSDDALLVYKETATKGFRLFRKLDVEKLSPPALEVSRALDVLRDLHRQRNRQPIADTIASLLEAVRAHAGVAFWVAGEQALANLSQLTDLARRYEASGGRSFRGFVDLLARQAERGEVPEAPIVEEASEGVRMMTVHGAKGLEFPVVILADPSCPMTQKNPSQWVDQSLNLWSEPLAHCVPKELRDHSAEALKRDREEAVRLTYVAATRARDLLVVPVVGDEELPGWVDVLHPVLYPSDDDKRRALPAPGCPKFGTESVLDRPDKARFRTSVMPGLHRSERGMHEVVWWDPAALDLDKRVEAGLHAEPVLYEKGGEENAARSVADYEAWAAQRDELLEAGAKPTLKVEFAAHATQVPGIEVTLEQTAAPRDGRPGGRRFGALVHAALSDVPMSGAELERFVTVHARRLGATEEERLSAIDAVRAALDHPLWQRAAASGTVRREAPLTLTQLDGTVAEGLADLAFRDADGWAVVDFKTDHELAERRPEYERQLAVYAKAISDATGETARAWLLSV